MNFVCNMAPKVAIIILNWNGWEDTIECLESVYQLNYSNYQVVVVDNSSEDQSLVQIRQYCQGQIKIESPLVKYDHDNKPIKVIELFEDGLNSEKYEFINESRNSGEFISGESGNSESTSNESQPRNKSKHINNTEAELILLKNRENHGFANGNNIAVDFALKNLNPDYVLLLNNDTVVDSELLTQLIEPTQKDVKIGCVGPKVYYYDYDGCTDVLSFTWEKINFYTSRGNRCGKDKVDNGQCDYQKETDKVEGCCMLLKQEVIQEVGLFDPVYFAYWEETDLCQRIKKAGWKLQYVPQAHMWHKVGMQWENYFSYFVIYHYVVRNRLIFMWRFTSSLQKLVFSIYFIFYLLANIGLMLSTQKWETSKEGFKAIKTGLTDFWAM